MTCEIQVDGGWRAGFGHLGRCLGLWEELGGRATFVVEDDAAASYLIAQGATAAREPGDASIVVLDRAKPVEADAVASLQAQGKRVVVIDELGSGRAVADLVVDPPTAAEWPPTDRPRLAGFEHVLLRRVVREARDAPRGASVLLAVGGSDPAGLTPALDSALGSAGIELMTVVGPGYRGAIPYGARSLARSGDWASALARSCVYVGGYGHSLLEAAHLGTPAVAVVFRAGHLPHAAAFVRNGTAEMIDMLEVDGPQRVVDAVVALLADPRRQDSMSKRGRELIDGRGSQRVAEAIEALL